MDSQAFQRLVNELEGLSAEQRTTVAERIRLLDAHADSARLITERLGSPAACPHCASTALVRFGHTGGQQRFRCKACTRTFVALTGTPLLRLREKEKLLAHATCMSRGETIRSSAAGVGRSVDRAFRWRHRFLEFLARQQPPRPDRCGRGRRDLLPAVVQGPAQGFAAAGETARWPADAAASG